MTVDSISFSPPEDGVITSSNGEYIYTPVGGWSGTDIFKYTANFSDGSSPEANISITVRSDANDSPLSNQSISCNQGASATLTLPDLSSYSQGQHGSVTYSGGVLTYTPTSNYFSPVSGGGGNTPLPDTFTVQRTLDSGDTSSATISVTVNAVNQFPLVNPNITLIANENSAAYINVLSGDTDVESPDGIFHPQMVVISGQPAHGSATIDSNGNLTYIPTPGYVGIDIIDFQAYNNDNSESWFGGTSIVHVTVLPVDQAPFMLGRHDYDININNSSGSAGSVNVLDDAYDPDGRPLTLGILSQPAGGTASIVGGAIQFTMGTVVNPNSGYEASIPCVVSDGVLTTPVNVSVFAAAPVSPGSPSAAVSQEVVNSSVSWDDGQGGVTTVAVSGSAWVSINDGVSVQYNSSNTSITVTSNEAQFPNVAATDENTTDSLTEIGNMLPGSNTFAGCLTMDSTGSIIGSVTAYNVSVSVLSTSTPGMVIGSISAFNNITDISADTITGSISAGNSITDGNQPFNIEAYNIGGGITATNGSIGSVNIFGNLGGNISASGNIGSVTFGRRYVGPTDTLLILTNYKGNITSTLGGIGPVSATGSLSGVIQGMSVGDINAGYGFSGQLAAAPGSFTGSVIAVSGGIASVDAPGYINGFITAQDGNISVIAAGLEETATIRAGTINWIGGYNDAGPTLVGGIISAITTIQGISSDGDISGVISAYGQIGFNFPDAGADTAAPTGLIAGCDITALVSAGSIIVYHADRDAIGNLAVQGNIQQVTIGRDFNAQWALGAGTAGLPITVGRDAIGSIADAGGFANVVIGRNDIAALSSTAGGISSLDVGGPGRIPFSDGSITGNISVYGDIGSISIFDAPGQSPIPSAANVTVGSTSASIGSFTSDGGFAGNIAAGSNIGPVETGLILGGDLSGSLDAASGYIAQIIVNDGNLSASLTAATNIGYTPFGGQSIQAAYNVSGGITAGNDIAQVISTQANVSSSINSSSGSIGDVEALDGSITGNGIIAYVSIGNISAGDAISAPITATTGSVGSIEAGMLSPVGTVVTGGGVIIDTGVIPTSDDGMVSFNGTSFSVDRILNPFSGASGGNISGNVTAGGDIGSISALGTISGNVDAGSNLGTVWASGDISGDLTSGTSISAVSWGSLTGNTYAQSSITLSSYNDISSSISSVSGGLSATSWENTSSDSINVNGSVAMWSAGNITGTSIQTDQILPTDGSVAGITCFGTLSDSVNTADGMTINANAIANASYNAGAGNITLVAPAGISNANAGPVSSISPQIDMPLEKVVVSSYGDITGSFVGGTVGLQVFGRSFQGAADAYGPVSIVTKLDVKPGTTVTTFANHIYNRSQINVEAENVSGTFVGAGIIIDAFGSVSGTLNASASVSVTSSSSMNAQINAPGGSVTVISGGVLNAPITSSGNITISGLDVVSGNFNSSAGGVSIRSFGSYTGNTTAFSDVQVISLQDVSGSIISSQGSVSALVKGTFSGTITAGCNAGVQVLGAISSGASITAGTMTASGDTGQYNATVSSYGAEAASINASNSVFVTATGAVSGNIVAIGGEADISTASDESGNVSAVTKILSFADSITGANFVSSGGTVGISSLHDMSATISAASLISAIAGGNATVTASLVDSGGSLLVSGLASVTVSANNIPNATVNIFSGGSSTVTAGSDNNPASNILLAAFGSIQGALVAENNITVASWGSISQLSTTTFSPDGLINLFSKGSLNATAHSGDAVLVSSLADVSGNFWADAPTAQTGTTEVDALGSINATVQSINNSSITAVGDISGSITSGPATVTAGGGISANVTVSGGDAIVSAIGGDVSGAVTADGNATVSSGTGVSGDVQAGASANVNSLGAISGSTSAGLDCSIEADNAISGSVEAGRDVSEYGGSVEGNISGGRNVEVASGGDISSAVSAGTDPILYGGGNALVQALGNISGQISADGMVEVDSDGDISGSATAVNSSVIVLAGGNVGETVTAGTSASVSAMGSIQGNVTAQAGATILAVGSITSDISVGNTGSASVVAGGTVDGQVMAGQDVTIESMGAVSGSAGAGDVVTINALGDESDNVSAGTDGTVSGVPAASLFAYGNLTGTVTTGSSDVVAIAFGNESANITSAGNATAEAFGELGGSINTTGWVNAESTNAGNVTIDAGTSATVLGDDDLTVSGSAGIDGNGLGFEIDSVGDTTTKLTALGSVIISAGGEINGSALSSLSGVNAIAGGAANLNATSNIGNASVTSLGNLSGKITAPEGIAAGETYGQAGSLTITGGQEADLTALGGGDATVDSTSGPANVFSGGNMSLTSEAYTNLLVGCNGILNITQGIADTGSVEAVATGDLNGSLLWAKLGSVTALSVQEAYVTAVASTNVTVFGGSEVLGSLTGNDVEAVSYGQVALGVLAADDLWVFAGGNIVGVYFAGNSVQSFASDGSINATITAGSGVNSGAAGWGTINGVSAWGEIAGSIVASVSIGGITAGGLVTAHVSVPAGTTVSITQGDSSLIGSLPLLGDVGQAALAAEVSGLIAQGGQLQTQLQQQTMAIQQQLTDDSAQAEQLYQGTQGEFATAKTQATAALAASDTALSATLTQAKSDDQTALGDAETQVTKIKQQLNTQAASDEASDLNSLAEALQGVTAAQAKIRVTITNAGQVQQQLVQATIQELGALNQKLVTGKAQHETAWQTSLSNFQAAMYVEHVIQATPTYLGYTLSQWLDIYVGFQKGGLQGWLNAFNGLTDGVIGIANLAIWASPVGQAASFFNWNVTIPSPDWSNGLVVTESDTSHNVSKFLGGYGLTELLTFGLSSSGFLCKLLNWGCFAAGTEVITGQNADGTYTETPIQDIQVGDYVLSRNQFDPNGPLQEEQVTAVEQHTVYTLQNVTVIGADGKTEVIQATPTHPFYVQGAGWTDAGDLVAGEELEEPDGSFATVISSVDDPQSAGVTVYNFTVADDHTYFVDQGGAVVWVHNAPCTRLFAFAADLADKGAHLHVNGIELRVIVQDGELAFESLTPGASASTVRKAVQAAETYLSKASNLEAFANKVQQAIPYIRQLTGRNVAQSVQQMTDIVNLLIGG